MEASFTDGSGVATIAADAGNANGSLPATQAPNHPAPVAHSSSSARRSWAFDRVRGGRTSNNFKAASQRMLPAPSLPPPTYSDAQFQDMGGRLVPRMTGTTMQVGGWGMPQRVVLPQSSLASKLKLPWQHITCVARG
jgi:hypothetical protein